MDDPTDTLASKADKAEEVREAGMRGVQDRLYADVQTVRPVALIRPVRPVGLSYPFTGIVHLATGGISGYKPRVLGGCTQRWHQVFGCSGDEGNCIKADKAGLASEAGNEG